MVKIVSRNSKKGKSIFSDAHNKLGAWINDENQLCTSRVTRSQKWKEFESNSPSALASHALNDVYDVGSRKLKKQARILKDLHNTDMNSNIISTDGALSTSKKKKGKSFKVVDSSEHKFSNQRLTRSQKETKIELNPSAERKVNSIRDHRETKRSQYNEKTTIESVPMVNPMVEQTDKDVDCVLRSSRKNTENIPTVPKPVQKACKEIKKRELIEMHCCENVQDGQIVLIKWPSYPYWPAQIKGITKTLVDVEFFGDNRLAFIFEKFKIFHLNLLSLSIDLHSLYSRTAKVRFNQIYDFSKNYQYIRGVLQSRQWKNIYREPIKQTEEFLKVPERLSILKTLNFE